MANKNAKDGLAFKHGDKVVACPKAMQDGTKAGKLMNRTGLTADELATPMHVIQTTSDGQLKIKHERVLQPFIVHPKFMTHAQA